MFDRLTSSLVLRAQVAFRPRPADRRQYIRNGARGAPRAARRRRRAPVVKTFTEAVKARAIGVEVTKSLTPGTGLHQGGARGTDAAHGRAEHRPQSARAASGGRDARRPARRRQDHERRQTRPLADREAKQKSVDGQHRRLSSGGHFATADPGRAGGRGLCGGDRERSAGRHRQARADRSDAAGLRRAAARHGGPFARRCRNDGGSRANSRRRSSRTSACSSWTAWPARTRSTPPRPSTTP